MLISNLGYEHITGVMHIVLVAMFAVAHAHYPIENEEEISGPSFTCQRFGSSVQ